MSDYDESLTYKKAVNGLEREQWLKAMQAEWDSLKSNQVWNLVFSSFNNRSIFRGRWVFKKKLGVDDKIVRFKARWVVKEFLQREKIDYNETYSEMIKLTRLDRGLVSLNLALAYSMLIVCYFWIW